MCTLKRYGEWFSVPAGMLGNVWRRCRPSKDRQAVRVRYRHPAGRGQGCRSTPHKAQACPAEQRTTHLKTSAEPRMRNPRPGERYLLYPPPPPPTVSGGSSPHFTPRTLSLTSTPTRSSGGVPKCTFRQTHWPSQPHSVPAARTPSSRGHHCTGTRSPRETDPWTRLPETSTATACEGR